MSMEFSLGLIAIALVVLVSFLIYATVKSMKALQTIQSDLHHLSRETANLIVNLSELSSDIKSKSHSLGFLFKPLSFLSSDSSQGEGSAQTIPQIMEWLTSSFILVKKAKEFIKSYGK